MTSLAIDHTNVGRRQYVLAVLALAIGGFTIGTTEFATMGVLPQVADGVHVSIPQAGHVISAYAVGVVVGVPILSFFAVGLPRKGLLMGLMGAYALFNAVSAVAPSYGVLFVARFLDGMPHGAYFGIASIVAATLADPRHRGRAVASVMLGLSVANVVGVPAATWLGEHGGWRAPFFAVAGLALLTVAMVMLFVPRLPGDADTGDRVAQGREFFGNLQVWVTMAAAAIGFGGLFSTYTYIAKTVTDVAHLPEHTVPLFVAGYGVGMVFGTWSAGELARWSVVKSLFVGSGGIVVVMGLYWLLSPQGWWLMLPVVGVMSVGAILTINLQIRLMDVAGNAVTLGAAMTHAAFNLANALGAYLGGVAIDAGYGYRSTPVVGAILAVLGVGVLALSLTVGRESRPTFPYEEGR